METEILADWASFDGLEPAWRTLLAGSRSACLFTTWEWAQAWRRAVGAERVRPFVVVVRSSGQVAGIAPMYVARHRLAGVVGYRTLRLMGDQHAGGDYLDWIVGQQREREVTGAIAHALATVRARWDFLWMPNLPGWTGARERLAEACRDEGLWYRERPLPFSAVDLPADFPTYLATLSANARSSLRRRMRQVLDRPGITVERCASEVERPAFLQALFELNDRRWAALGQRGVFVRRPLEAAFYEHFSAVALSRGWLRLFAIRQAGRFEAVHIGYVFGRTFYQLQEGFDPGAPAGIGNVLRARIIEECIREGVSTYDFLEGTAEHKRRWGARIRQGSDVFITRPSLKGTALHRGGLWPTGRFLRPAGPL